MIFETENIEFKVQATDEIYKEVIAFANTDGGVIYIGIDDNGTPIGIDEPDEVYTRITNGIRDAIMPDVTMFIKYTLQENGIMRITVNEGTSKPYCLRSKGLKPGGVFVRQGTSSVPASFEQIRSMIKMTDGEQFERMRCMENNLTFTQAATAFSQYGIDFGKEKYRALGMTDDSDSLFTNLALIMSDQCPHTIKIAVFADKAKTQFRDSKEFAGSVFEQLENAFSYLMLCNKTTAEFSGLTRIEKSDYPQDALREALLNALVHRDYAFSGSIIINVNDDEIEFISIGGLLPGLSTEDIRSGISQPRNQNLAAVFHRLRLIESYGTGIRKIFSVYENCPLQPKIEVTTNSFKIILPNMNKVASVCAPKRPLSKQESRIMDYAKANGSISTAEICQLLNVKNTRAYTIAKQLCDQDLLQAQGKGTSRTYIPC